MIGTNSFQKNGSKYWYVLVMAPFVLAIVIATTLFKNYEVLAVSIVGAALTWALVVIADNLFGMLFLGLHSQGNLVNEIFWGLWLFPFGLLVMRSGFLPSVLGVLLIVNGFAYLAVSLTSLFAPDYARIVSRATLPALLGELWIILWLLIKGVKVPRLAAPA